MMMHEEEMQDVSYSVSCLGFSLLEGFIREELETLTSTLALPCVSGQNFIVHEGIMLHRNIILEYILKRSVVS